MISLFLFDWWCGSLLSTPMTDNPLPPACSLRLHAFKRILFYRRQAATISAFLQGHQGASPLDQSGNVPSERCSATFIFFFASQDFLLTSKIFVACKIYLFRFNFPTLSTFTSGSPGSPPGPRQHRPSGKSPGATNSTPRDFREIQKTLEKSEQMPASASA